MAMVTVNQVKTFGNFRQKASLLQFAAVCLQYIYHVFFVYFTESQYLIYPAVLTMSSAGVFCSFAFFQVRQK